MSYRVRLQTAFVLLGLAAILLMEWEASAGATEALRQATYDGLTAVRRSKVQQVERWFQDLGNHALALATDESTIQALEEFARSWSQLPAAPGDALRRHYTQVHAPAEWFPSDPRVVNLQHHFIAANPHPLGHKDRLLIGPGTYGRVHARFHPTLHRYQSAFGFYDVLLIEGAEARVVYSVFKEFDFGARLTEQPYRGSALAEVYRKAMEIEEAERYVLQDYQVYIPSHSTPAAFLAAPIWRSGVKQGVLAIQVSPAELDRLMASDAMGSSGRLSIVGPDGTLRNGESILRARIADFQHDTEETSLGVDANGKRLLRSHARLSVPGLDWALMAELDEEEAFAPVRRLRRRIFGIGALIAMVFFAAAAWLARSVTEPVLALERGARRLGQLDFGFRLPVKSRDEIGRLAESFNRMAEDLERTTVSKGELEVLAGRLITAQEEERQRVARELHDDITQRMAAVAIEAGTLAKSAGSKEEHAGLERIKDQMAQLSREIHRLSRRLHPKLLDDLGLVAAIEAETRALFERGGPLVEFTRHGDWTGIPKPVELALYRIVQEGLRNVEKHSGAEEAGIRLERSDNGARLRITDNGRGFAGRHPGLGLASMEERARLLGGRFEVSSSPGKGTTLEVWLPL